MKIYKILLSVIFLIIGIIVFSCNPVKKTAKKIIKSDSVFSVFILEPVYLFKDNYKNNGIQAFDTLSEYLKDSIALQTSDYIRYVDDSAFFQLYYSSMIGYLEEYNLKVYTTDSMDVFLSKSDEAYIFVVAQMLLEEYYEYKRKVYYLENEFYDQYLRVNTAMLNTWLETSVMNGKEKDSGIVVLYSYEVVRDKVKFKKGMLYTGDVNKDYNIDTLTIDGIYTLASTAAYTQATYIYDYILNREVRKVVPLIYDNEYLHYDPLKKRLKFTRYERFIEILP